MPPEFIRESDVGGPLFALGVFLALALIAIIARIAFGIAIKHRQSAAPDGLDTQVLRTVRGPSVISIVILGFFLGFLVLTQLTGPTFSSLNGLESWATKVWIIVVIAQVSHLGAQLTQVIIAWYIDNVAARTATQVDDRLLPPLKRVLPSAIYAVGTLVALDTVGVSISPLLAGLGIGGLAVALAVQPTLSNFFAGTYLVTEGELNDGDYIEIQGGPAGYVVDVGWRSTKIRSRYNNLVIIPNSKMVDSIVTNYFSPTAAMNVIVTCGVSYDADLAHVERVVLEITQQLIDESPHAVKETAPFFGFSTFGDSNIDFWVFLQATDRTGTFILKSELIKRIHARFKDEGIEINYPVRKLVNPAPNGLAPEFQAANTVAEQFAGSDDEGG